ncbi:MAG: LytR/AlgR family response regulator transcription factor [Crocinitomicaceae bacterium]
MINYLIIDDEPIAHDIIIGYCNKVPNMTLMHQSYDALEALDYLRTKSVDLIFLDLNMPKLHGYDFLKTLPNQPKVIVTTAYQEFAVEGYELEIADYLLKPFSFERFLKAINKSFMVSDRSRAKQSDLIKPISESIFLHSDKKHIQVNISDILFVEAAGNYSKVVLTDGKVMVREKISDMLTELLPHSIFRVHKSFIVAKTHINSVEGNMIHIQNYTVPVGKMYKSNVNELFKPLD